MRARHLAGLVPVCFLVACGGKTPPASAPGASAAVAASAAPKPDGPQTESPPMQSDELRAMLPKEQVAEYFAKRGGDEKPGAFFEPTRAEIEKLEGGLAAMVEHELRGQPATKPPLWEKLGAYKRQYVSYVDAAGTRWIWGNFMCTNPGRPGSDAWRNKVVRPDHGGDCFFNVEYSPDTGKFRRFGISGDD